MNLKEKGKRLLMCQKLESAQLKVISKMKGGMQMHDLYDESNPITPVTPTSP
jgi:CheY-specific phosphatase CheX